MKENSTRYDSDCPQTGDSVNRPYFRHRMQIAAIDPIPIEVGFSFCLSLRERIEVRASLG